MKKIVALILVFFTFLGCEPKLKPEKPDNLIPKDKMADVLKDIFVVNSAKGISRLKLEKVGLNPEEYILKKHNVDSLRFAQSNNYYAHDVEAYTAIIEDVKAKITAEKDIFTALEKEEQEKYKRRKDSIRKARQELKANPVIK